MPEQFNDLVDYDHLALYDEKIKQVIGGKADDSTVVKRVTVGGSAAPMSNNSVALGSAAGASTESTLTDGANLPTGSAVKAYVDSALASAGSLTKEVVQTVPSAADADENTLYYVMNSTTGYYDVYQKIGGSVVRLDDVSIDLSGYVQSSDISVVTNAQINALFESGGE